MTGQITRIVLERGFAFIAGQDGLEYFCHATQLARGTDLADLRVDEEVEFETQASVKGPRAINARPVSIATP